MPKRIALAATVLVALALSFPSLLSSSTYLDQPIIQPTSEGAAVLAAQASLIGFNQMRAWGRQDQVGSNLLSDRCGLDGKPRGLCIAKARPVVTTTAAVPTTSATTQTTTAATAPPTSTTATTRPPTTTTTRAVTTTAPPPTTAPPTTTIAVGAVPSGAVPVLPGQSIQGAVDANPEGTTFFLRAGTHRRQHVSPKNRDVFLGEAGTILDGENAVSYAFEGGGDFVTIRGLVIQNYANPLQTGVIRSSAQATDWLVEGNELRQNAGAAIDANVRWRVIGNYIHHNGQIGMKGGGADILVQNNEIAYNNTNGHDPLWEAGGTKFLKTTNLVLRGNYVHDNRGPGLWADHNNINTLYEDNRVVNNFGPGIFHEISYDAVIRNNIAEGNGFGYTAWVDGAGILVNSSPNVEIYGNTVRNNNDGIAAVQTDRGSGAYGAFQVRNLYVHNNTIVMSSGMTGIATSLSSTDVFTSWGNRFDANAYKITAVATPYAWTGGWKTIDQWRAAGQDVNGSWQ